MNLNFKNDTVDIWTRSHDAFGLCTKNRSLAFRLNRILHHYPKDTVFSVNDEPQFFFSKSQIQYIAAEIPYMRKILAQITGGLS